LASTFAANPSLSDWEKRTLIASWLDDINAAGDYDYVIFDCPPATKIVSQNALAASHGYIVPVIPDELSSRGVTHFASLVQNKIDAKLNFLKGSAPVPANQIPSNYVGNTKMAAIVPSLVKTSGNAASKMTNIHTTQLAALRRQWGASVIGTVGKHYIAIPEALNAGLPVWNFWGQNARRDIKNMMTSICSDLKIKIDAL
jgi:chromosome partitioning protein